MSRVREEVIYEAEDYEKLKKMSKQDICAALDEIDDGWLGSSRYCGQKDFEGDESDYNKYRLHQALRQAIELL